MNNLSKILRDKEFLQHIPNEELRAVVPYFSLQSYERGTVIFAQGEPVDGLYILASGTCVAEKVGGIRYVSQTNPSALRQHAIS